MTEVKRRGFSSEDEVRFLNRLESVSRRVNLEQEVKTQLAEDFGMIQFTLKYDLVEGKIVDRLSGESVVEMTERGGVSEETESIRKIETGLNDFPGYTWIHFSPVNEKLGYPNNCVDFWRTTADKVVWNRLVVKDDFKKMNQLRSFLSGEKRLSSQSELVRSPIKSDLKLSELFDLFRLSEIKNTCTFDLIESVVGEYVDEFETGFGETLTDNPDKIFRLYSACYSAIQGCLDGGDFWDRDQLGLYMFGEMNRVMEVESFGCAATTTVGEYGEKIGYYISGNGKVKYGEIPDGYKQCKKCGCWYKGEKCPFC